MYIVDYSMLWLGKPNLFCVTVLHVDIYSSRSLQFLTRSIARTTDVVNVLAAFGLAYVIVKFFVGVLQEMKHAGLVLVQDRPGFHKMLFFAAVEGVLVSLLLAVIGEM